jgi:hypothetical protein
MTTCVASICDEGNAIVLVADKMIGMGYVESELARDYQNASPM